MRNDWVFLEGEGGIKKWFQKGVNVSMAYGLLVRKGSLLTACLFISASFT